MRIAVEWQVAEILERFLASLGGNRLIPNITTQHLSHFDVDEMRSVERLRRNKHSVIDLPSDGRLKKPLDCGRGIQNNHRASRSRRTASAADGGSAIRERWRKRSRSSARAAGPLGKVAHLRQKEIRKRHPGYGGLRLQGAIHAVRHIANLNHLGHVLSIIACGAHVKPVEQPKQIHEREGGLLVWWAWEDLNYRPSRIQSGRFTGYGKTRSALSF